MRLTRAIVRKPGRNFEYGITTSDLGRPDPVKAAGQHEAYCLALERCGLEVTVLEADERYPDGCFVEDTAIVTGKCAIITRPGAVSRRGETEAIANIMSGYRKLEILDDRGTVEGGDVLRVEDHFFIGISGRTDREGAGELSAVLSKYGYTSSQVVVKEGLHLKSGISYHGDGIFISAAAFTGISESGRYIIPDENESYFANCLKVNDHLLIPDGFPGSKRKIAGLGYSILELDVSEFRKMDGGLTCLSLLF